MECDCCMLNLVNLRYGNQHRAHFRQWLKALVTSRDREKKKSHPCHLPKSELHAIEISFKEEFNYEMAWKTQGHSYCMALTPLDFYFL